MNSLVELIKILTGKPALFIFIWCAPMIFVGGVVWYAGEIFLKPLVVNVQFIANHVAECVGKNPPIVAERDPRYGEYR